MGNHDKKYNKIIPIYEKPFFIIILPTLKNANLKYQMQSLSLFPLFYLPPVNYFSALNACNFQFILEKYEHFPKQTFRNRCNIDSPNGGLALFLPVIKGAKYHTQIKDVKISYDFKWQRLHWLSLQNAYRNSAYFEFYEDDIAPFYYKEYKYLFDYNLEFLTFILKQLKKTPTFSFTNEYVKTVGEGLDFRTTLQQKKPDLNNQQKTYFQVFEDRNGFLPNLSIVDLLFNQGPQAKNYL